jgi:hypothetical protein
VSIRVFTWNESNRERPASDVPLAILLSLILAIILQVVWHQQQSEPIAGESELHNPPKSEVLFIASTGDATALSKLIMLWLQAFDHQPGLSIPFSKLDYAKVIAWLDEIALLDPGSQYPYLLASRVYAKVLDDKKKRMMLDFVHRGFLKNPNLQWPAMTHAVFIAKHRLRDLDLALQYARDIRMHVNNPDIVSWVRQMELFVLEDMGEIESARILLGAFLESGVIKDQREFKFLQNRLGVPHQE